MTPLTAAVSKDRGELVKVLLKYGADPNMHYGTAGRRGRAA